MSNKGDSKEFFQEQADAYDRVHYGDGKRTFMSVRLERVLEILNDINLPRGSKVLDAGCGPGHFALTLAKAGHDVFAVDTSEAMLEELSRNSQQYGDELKVDAQIASIEKLPFADNSFDLICSLGVIEYLNSDDMVVGEFLRVLRPGGTMIVSVTNYWSPAGYLDYFVEAAKRQKWFLSMVNALWTRLGQDAIRARFFKIRRHRINAFRKKINQNVALQEIHLNFLD